jgi:hypothetical protein
MEPADRLVPEGREQVPRHAHVHADHRAGVALHAQHQPIGRLAALALFALQGLAFVAQVQVKRSAIARRVGGNAQPGLELARSEALGVRCPRQQELQRRRGQPPGQQQRSDLARQGTRTVAEVQTEARLVAVRVVPLQLLVQPRGLGVVLRQRRVRQLAHERRPRLHRHPQRRHRPPRRTFQCRSRRLFRPQRRTHGQVVRHARRRGLHPRGQRPRLGLGHGHAQHARADGPVQRLVRLAPGPRRVRQVAFTPATTRQHVTLDPMHGSPRL